MKPGARLRGDLRVQGPLGGRGETGSFLASGEGKSRKPRWVLKWLPAAGAQPLSSFLRPDLLDLASMAHASLALPASFGRDRASGRAFLLRPYVEGSDLLTAVRGRSPREMLQWMAAAAEALGLLHRAGFLHRNLKPSNLIVPRKALFARRPRGSRIVLCDPAWWPEGAEPALGEESVAPEILAGDRASTASDLHALGAVFYRLLSGRRIQPGTAGYPTPPSDLNTRVPADLDRVVLKLSSPDPSRRYRDAEDLIDDLDRLAGGRVAARAPPPDMLAGREEELTRVRSLLETPSRPTAIAITGEAGMGKSTFLRRIALEAQVLGRETAFARCYPESAAPLRTLVSRAIPAGASGRPIRSRLKKLLASASGAGPGGWTDAAGRRAFIRALLDLLADADALRPTVLVLDEVHLAGPMTIEFLQELVRDLGSASARDPASGARSPPSLVVSFRSESPFIQTLRPLIDSLGKAGDTATTIELPALPAHAVEEWIERSAGPGAAGAGGFLAALGGHPFLIREALRAWRSANAPEAPRVAPDLGQAHVTYLASLPDGGRRALEALSVLARPAEPELIAALAGVPRARWGPLLERLLKDGTLEREGSLVFFQHGSFQAWLLEKMEAETARRLHERIALSLAKRPGSDVEEVAHHWLHSGARSEGLSAYLTAARELSRTHEGRRAQRFYEAALEILPRGGRWRAVAGEAAETCARAGNHRRGIEILEVALGDARSPEEIGRLHGRIGVLRHRAGEVTEASFHLEKGLKLLEAGGGTSARERARIQSELAEILSNKGLYAEAEGMCREALGSLGDGRRARRELEARRDEMVLHETLAHLHLRRFQFREAEDLFQTSLEIGKEVGAVPERTLILNNLGTLHVQENRFEKAIACYEEAERLSAGLGDDQGLAIVLSNLAVLHARVGDPERADAAIARAAYHESRSDSARCRFLRLHSEGIVDLVFGRHGSAIDALRAAVLLGDDLKDVHMTAFELVYLAECHLHRGEIRAARDALDRAEAVRPAPPRPVRAMAAARRAAIAALRGERKEAEEECSVARRGLEGKVEYVDAWNRVFIGWALRLAGNAGDAREELEAAREFFVRVKVPSGEVHAGLEMAVLEMDAGALDAARARLEAIRTRYTAGRGVLTNPMLSARLLAYGAKLALSAAEPDIEAAESLLIEAESHLIGRRLKDLEVVVGDLKGRLRDLAGASGRVSPPGVESPVRSGAAALIVGRSAAIRGVTASIRQVAATALPVLIAGETGTGKELVARAIHAESSRRSGPLVTVNCAALPEALLEAQLFGWARGAFSGAEDDHAGLLRSAHGGTFLFDGIGEMSLALQAKLLRVLDTARVRPVGGAEEVAIDVRFIFSSHRGLRTLVDEERFRRDLFFRLGPFEIQVPPLRDRLADLPLLVEHFRGLAGLAEPAAFEEDALRALASHPWPGNVRELENVVTRLVLTSAERITAKDVRLALGKGPPEGQFSAGLLRSAPLEALLAQLEKEHLVQLHADCGGDLETIAARLGITVRALYGRFRRLGIQPGALNRTQGPLP